MPTVATVRLRYSSQEYWFDPAGSEIHDGDHVVVDTTQGREVGLCTIAAKEVADSEVVKPLKPIVRVADDDDLARVDELYEKSFEAMKSFRDKVAENKIDMKPVDVSFSFDGKRATFYFTSEERVDFRALVRDLASEYRVRVDMRQIGVRDEAGMVGGLGHCGEELCCARMGGCTHPVSIRMAKEQDLPLNPSKISGLCGRLMCCLRYEYDAYKDFKSRAPKKGALIDTPAGVAKVVEFDTPHETVRVRYEDGRSVVLPVSEMDTGDKVAREGENLRPCHISQEKFDKIIEELNHDKTLTMMSEKSFSSDPNLKDETAVAGAVEHTPQRRRRRSHGGSSQAQGESRSGQTAPRDQRKARRSVSVSSGGSEEKGGSSSQGQQQKRSSGSRSSRRRRRSGSHGQSQQKGGKQQQQQSRQQQGSQQSKPHPGQHSSTVSGDAAHEGQGQNQQGGSGGKSRRRRRHHRGSGKSGGSNAQGGSGSQGVSSSEGGGGQGSSSSQSAPKAGE